MFQLSGVFSSDHPAWLPAGALLVALLLDHTFGEPAARWHPVVWMGRSLKCCASFVKPCTSQGVQGSRSSGGPAKDWSAFWRGALVWTGLAALSTSLGYAVQWLLLQPVRVLPDCWVCAALVAVCLGIALKPMFAWRMLNSEVLAVETALARSLDDGREQLGRLASRDTRQLGESAVRETAIESLAENLNDSVVAPIFWFVLLGLPGAALYRFANTADAMWGYRGEYSGRNWEWAGKWAARADDVLSWLPARITAALLAMVGGGLSLRALRREAGRTPSPNSGWPMAAMALVLGLRLRKPGVYALNASGRAPQVADTAHAVRLADRSVCLLVFLVGGVFMVRVLTR